ncbi:hypothetical protein NEHOM01_0336 [Nematocida homosporus]|uniref:uncharacterized protein n=1 Tax=Nematocida homosporus TaxID=1912981 RepID=UPI00221F2DA9|nr:uncharacterized protein NEHOM01_0336 [Nematocida homosporus]KAI5184734.1 hypothetical protein NEHOM01_0336 [Nematocida homosporus]
MDGYSLNDTLIVGSVFKVKIKADLSNPYLESVLKGRRVENKRVYLPYYMIECLLGTEYIEVEPMLTKEQLLEIDGAPEHTSLEGTVVYGLAAKLAGSSLLPEESKRAVRAMHLRRAVRGARSLGDTEKIRGLSREEEETLRRGRLGWQL